MLHRMAKSGIHCEAQVSTKVFDEDGFCLGEYQLDLLDEDILVVEPKASRIIDDNHIAQLLGYLTATELNHGLLINFGAHRFQIRKFKT